VGNESGADGVADEGGQVRGHARHLVLEVGRQLLSTNTNTQASNKNKTPIFLSCDAATINYFMFQMKVFADHAPEESYFVQTGLKIDLAIAGQKKLHL
jgi:hypothetical protein